MEGPLPDRNFLSSIIKSVKEFHLFPSRVISLKSKTALVVLFIICLSGFVLLVDKLKPVSPELPEPISPPVAPLALLGEEDKIIETVTVEVGDTISYLTEKYYGMVNESLMTLILDSNPEIKDVNLIVVNQRVKIP